MPTRKKITPEILTEMLKSETQTNAEPEQEPEQEEVDNIVNNDTDFKDTIKSGILELSTIPMTTASNKRDRFKKELQENKFINKYIDKQINNSYLKYMNDHIKAMMIYSYTYAKVHKSL